jgi:LPS export ABC transporter protein LptC
MMKRPQSGFSVLFCLPLYAVLVFLFILLLASCSFDYGSGTDSENTQPDIVMNDVEYVRVRDGDPIVRFQAEKAERWEEKRNMELQQFSFEQFKDHSDETDALGRAGRASVELESGNIHLDSGVSIAIDSEDITIETSRLDWLDKEKILNGTEGEEVRVLRENGTSFVGHGFSADARSRTWQFSGVVSGSYIHDDDDDEAAPADEAANADNTAVAQ